MNYYERFCGDYSRDTADLSLAEHGAYTILLDVQYATERGLPGDHPGLYRICRAMTPDEQAAVRRVADEFFPIGEDGLRWNPRSVREIAKARVRIETARDNGRHGGRPRNPDTNPKQTQTKPVGLPVGSPEHNPTDNPDLTRGKALHTPQAIHQPQVPNANTNATVTPLAEPAKKPRDSSSARQRAESVSGPTWEAYSAAYLKRYGAPPVRNAKVNGMLAQVVGRLGAEEAPPVAAWYVASSNGLHVSARHCVDLLLRDCEGLRMEWATGRGVTQTQARQSDRTAATGNVFGGLIENERRRHG